jgi:hypothetical protein
MSDRQTGRQAGRQTDRLAGCEEVLHRYHIYVLFTLLKRALSYPLLTSLKRIGVGTQKLAALL